MREEALDRVKLIFQLFDVNRNGYLEPDDFELMSGRVVAAAAASGDAAREAIAAAFRQYWATLETELDTNADGKVSYDEFTACVLAPERFDGTIAQFADALSALGDPDGDGLVERPVFVALMEAIGFGADQIHDLYTVFGPDDNDRVPVPVWRDAIVEYYRPDKAGIAGDRLVPAEG
ncbi:EF-hand domain-containing protein [Kutzneria sp. CA-103260]|uniref:EF-hand domain-containing protein n=1 Tax=Kutzneria sp. CA-103260 TaxID=2802641 RepID=UPI001BAC94EC|nr:EF-hand domain-containing protein [Kutzneria sp. CA-103260]QUQ66639.1 calcium-binding protein [Kutzneria sp. CA-103260]